MGFLTAKSAADIYYITHRHTHNDQDTRKVLSTLFSLFELLDTARMDCRKAISSELTDYEDAMMTETALRCGMDCIVTRNLRDYEKSPVQTFSPSAFLTQIEKSALEE